MAQSIFFDVIARDKASSTFSRVGKSVDSTDSRLRKFGRSAANLAGLVGVAGFGAGLVSFFKDANSEAREAQKVGALTTQVIKSTGGAAKVTADHVGDLANSISRKVGIDDEAIQSGENLLLTFKKIRNEAGQGNAVFDRATRAAVNLSAAGFGSISSASKMVGKALNDPLKGLTALGRAGVTFTKGQQDQIKKLVETGHALKAQKIILKEIESQVGGAAKAQATAGDKARVAWKNLEEQIGTALLPTVDKLANFTANDLVPAVSEFVSGMQDGTGAGGDFVDVLRDAASVGKSAVQVLDAIPGPIKKLGVEGLIAYAVLRKLQAGATGLGSSLALPIARTKQMYAEMTYAETRMQKVSAASYAMGGAIRNAAGVGGMLLLAKSASASNNATATLMQTLGGAATGFAVGGPIGAAVGGLAGLMLGLSTNTHKAGKQASFASQAYQTYASSLDDATAALTRQTTAQVQETIRSKHLDKVLGGYGFTNRQIVQAIQHQGPLRQRMIADLKAEQAGITATAKALIKKHGPSSQEYQDYAKSVKGRADSIQTTLDELGAVSKAVKMKREDIAATRTFTKAIKALPPKVETYVRTNGLKPGIAGVIELARQIKLTPDEIRVLIKENGGKGTDAEIKRVQDRAAALGKMAPVVNVSAKTGQARTELGSFYKYLLDVTKPRTVNVRVKTGKAGGVGGLLAQGAGGGKGGKGRGGSSRLMEDSGRMVGDSYARGVDRSRSTVKKALAKFTELASQAADKLANLKEIRSGFASTFASDNLFGADLSSGGGLSALMAFEQQQANQASQLLSDVQNVLGKGLSKSLVSQLQSQGTSGAAALHALATGSASQIAQFNALDVMTQTSLQKAGMAAGNYVRGGNINSDIAAAARQENLLAQIVRELQHMKGDQIVVVDADGVVLALKKRNHKKGIRTNEQLLRTLT